MNELQWVLSIVVLGYIVADSIWNAGVSNRLRDLERKFELDCLRQGKDRNDWKGK